MLGTLVETSYVGIYVHMYWCVDTEKGRKHFCATYTLSGKEGEEAERRRLHNVSIRDCSCTIQEVPEEVLAFIEEQNTNS